MGSVPGRTAPNAVFTVVLEPGVVRHAVQVADPAALPGAIDALAVPRPKPVIVLIGGAGKLADTDAAAATAVIESAILPVATERGAVMVDGGTDSGIMRFAGRARAKLAPEVSLVGVAAVGTVSFPGNTTTRSDAASLQPDHTYFVFVPGVEWGAESPWLPRVAAAIAEGRPVVTVLINGGSVSAQDVRASMQSGFPVVIARGTGRLADQLAEGGGSDSDLSDIVTSPLVHVSGSARPEAVRDIVVKLLQ